MAKLPGTQTTISCRFFFVSGAAVIQWGYMGWKYPQSDAKKPQNPRKVRM